MYINCPRIKTPFSISEAVEKGEASFSPSSPICSSRGGDAVSKRDDVTIVGITVTPQGVKGSAGRRAPNINEHKNYYYYFNTIMVEKNTVVAIGLVLVIVLALAIVVPIFVNHPINNKNSRQPGMVYSFLILT